MQYKRYTFSLVKENKELSNEILFDLLADCLSGLDFDSFEQDENASQMHAYRPAKPLDDSIIRKTVQGYPIEGVEFDFSSQELPKVNWNEEWEKHSFRPIDIDKRIYVRAPFHPAKPEIDQEILISPRMAFGTGNHQTTRLMIRLMLDCELKGKQVLDMGTGTGILAIAAAKLGAEQVVAIDIDECCYENCQENARLNGVESRIGTKQGDANLLTKLDMSYQFILANINRNILLEDLPKYLSHLESGGQIAISGFLTSDEERLKEKALSLGLKHLQSIYEDEWAAMLFETK